ncbi:hypothetical protein SteCoe_9221 [Stentor coeruleus]|uniref:Uncharacterized protein n=1 Tax=Stentor coeruleus TaxID=5963 RepID=A0A1R2CIA2_9CILI|nr:hypothetical protein SteCoe_9221 [Stentor coeruleus]
MVLMLIFFLSACAEQYISFDEDLSPKDIYFPLSWANNIIELSSNNANETVSIKITCFFSAKLYPGTFIQGIFPGFPQETIEIVLDLSQEKNSDKYFLFTNIVLPSEPGSYGPVSLIVRVSETSQIIASTESLGIIGIVNQKKYSTTELEVTYDILSSQAIQMESIINFSITILIALHKYDYMVLNWPDCFTTSDKMIVTFKKGSDGYAYISTTSTYFDYEKRQIMFYGLQSNTPAGITANIQIKGFINPQSVILESPTWTFEIFGFGTYTTLAIFTAVGPGIPSSGNITSITWLPSNDYLENIQYDDTRFMTLTFVPAYKIPKSGSFIATFTGVDLTRSFIGDETQELSSLSDEVSSYYAIDPISSISSCTVGTFTINCQLKSTEEIEKDTLITIYIFVKFTSSSKATLYSIITKSSDNLALCKTSGTLPIFYLNSDTIVQIIEPRVYFVKEINANFIINSAEDSGEYFLLLSFSTPVPILADQIIYVKGPFNTASSIQNSEISLSESLFFYYKIDKYEVLTFTTSMSISTAEFNGNTFNFTVQEDITEENYYFNSLFGGGTISVNGDIQRNNFYFPYYSSNIYTRHEIAVYYTVENITYQFIKPLTISPLVINPSLEFVCKSAGFEGITAHLTLTPNFNFPNSVDSPLYIQFTIEGTGSGLLFGGDMSTGLSSGSNYPSYSTSGTVTIEYSSGDRALFKTNFILSLNQNIIKNQGISIYLPIEALQANKLYKSEATIYLYKNSHSEKYSLAYGISDSVISFSSVTSHLVTPTNSDVYIGSTNFYDFVYKVSPEWSQGKVTFMIGKHFSVTSSLSLTIGSNVAKVYPLISDDVDFPYNSIFATDIITTSDSDLTWTLSSIIFPWYSMSESKIIVTGSDDGDECTLNVNSIAKINYKYLSLSSISTTCHTGQGKDCPYFNVTFTMTLPGDIIGSSLSSIIVTMSEDFSVEGKTFTIKSSDLNYQGTVSNSKLTVNSILNDIPMQDLIFDIYYLTPPIVTTSNINKQLINNIDVFYDSNIVYTYSDTINKISEIEFIPGTSIEGISIKKITLFPNVQGTKMSNLEIYFQPKSTLPPGSVLEISGENFIPDNDIIDNLWFNHKWSKAEISSNKLLVTIAKELTSSKYVQLRKDNAINILEDSINSQWTISAYYESILIMYDLVSQSSGVVNYQSSSTLSFNILNPNFTVSISNQGFESYYTFEFTLSTTLPSDAYFVIKVPKSYNAHFGPVYQLNQASNIYYLYATSNNHPILCSVDHWVVVCDNIYANSKKIYSITILAINPSSSNSGDFCIFFTNKILSVFYAIYQDGLSYENFTSVPGVSIDLSQIYLSDHTTALSNYVFEVYLDENFDENSYMIVNFPKQYSLDNENDLIIQCKALYYLTQKGESLITASVGCSISDNQLSFNIEKAKVVESDNKIFLSADSITNPKSGIGRTSKGDTFKDATDTSKFIKCNYWTEKFQILSINSRSNNTDTLSYSGMSHYNLNAGYLAFNASDDVIFISGYEDSIKIAPGMISSKMRIYIEGGLKAYYIKLTPVENSNTLFFNADSYELTQNAPWSSFRVGCKDNCVEWFYYLRWEIYEKGITSLVQYWRPSQILVEVNYKYSASIVAETISNLPNNGRTFPVLLSISGDYFPVKDLIVKLTLSNPKQSITLSTSSINFDSTTNSAYFHIINTGVIETKTTYQVLYEIIPSNPSFTIQSESLFTIDELYATQTTITSLNLTSYNSTSIHATIDLSTPSILTWVIGHTNFLSENDIYNNYDNLTLLVFPLEIDASDSQQTISEQLSEYQGNLYIEKSSDYENYESYTKKILVLSKNFVVIGCSYHNEGISTIFESNVMAPGQEYMIRVWADNYSGTLSFIEKTGMTESLPLVIKGNVTFENSNDLIAMDTLYNVIAVIAGIDPLRIVLYDYSLGRRLDKYVTEFFILSNPFDSNETLAIYESVNLNLVNTLKKLGVSTSDITFLADFITPDECGSPKFKTSNFYSGQTNVTLNFTTTIDGYIYCII